MNVAFNGESTLPIVQPTIRLRFSEVLTFLKCRKKHEIEWNREIEPRVTNDKFFLGTLGHAALKALFNNTDPFLEVDNEIQLYLTGRRLSNQTELLEMGRVAISCAEKAYTILIKQYRPVMVEETLWYNFSPDVQLTGTPDLVAEHTDTGTWWLFDHKFRENFRPPESELFNLQMYFYTKLLQLSKNVNVVGSRQLQIRPFEPKTPKVTAKGKISRQNITTDWETYKLAVLNNGQAPADYADMREKLQDYKFYDFESCAAYRTQEEIDAVWEGEILPAVRAIVASKKDFSHPSRCFDFGTCNFCSVKDLCVAELKGEDTSVMLRTTFKKKGEKPQQLVAFDE